MGSCVACGRPEAAITARIGAQVFAASPSSVLCSSCGSLDRAIARHLAMLGPVSGAGFRCLREAASLSGKELAALLGTRPATISQWETSAVRVDLWAWATVASIALDDLVSTSLPTAKVRLEAYRAGTHPSRVEVVITEQDRRLLEPGTFAFRAHLIEIVRDIFADENRLKYERGQKRRKIGIARQVIARRRYAVKHVDEDAEVANRAQYEAALLDERDVLSDGRGDALRDRLSQLHHSFAARWSIVRRALVHALNHRHVQPAGVAAELAVIAHVERAFKPAALGSPTSVKAKADSARPVRAIHVARWEDLHAFEQRRVRQLYARAEARLDLVS